jgi:hypothetical protein
MGVKGSEAEHQNHFLQKIKTIAKFSKKFNLNILLELKKRSDFFGKLNVAI